MMHLVLIIVCLFQAVKGQGSYSLEGPGINVSSRNRPLHLQSAAAVEGADELADIGQVHGGCDVVTVRGYKVMIGLNLILKKHI